MPQRSWLTLVVTFVVCVLAALADAHAAPVIQQINPTSGNVQQNVTITGTGFGATRGTSTVTFNGTAATVYPSWGDQSITVTVPNNSWTGAVVVTVGGVASNNNFIFTVAPRINSLAPTAGGEGQMVTIVGANFGATQGTGTVTFNGVQAPIQSWSNQTIVAVAPAGATTGSVIVTASGMASGTASTFTVQPGVRVAQYHLHAEASSVSPHLKLLTAGPDVAVQNLLSANLANSAAGSYLVRSFLTEAGVPGNAGTIPAGSTLGFIVHMRKTAAGTGSFNPRVEARLNSATGTLLCQVNGSTALTQNATPYTLSCNTSAAVTLTSTDRIYLWVGVQLSAAQGATAVNVELRVEGTLNGNHDSRVGIPLGPSITSLSTTSGPVGQTVTITGSSFGAVQGSSAVKFNGTTAVATTWSPSSIVTTVPTGTTTGAVTVTLGTNQSNGVTFTVTPPNISGISPSGGIVGQTVTIDGTGFGTPQGTVKFNGVAATSVPTWTPTQITALVPSGATTGPLVVVTAGNQSSNGVTFNVAPPPQITSLSTPFGVVGQQVTISGSNFGASQGTSTVRFNGVVAAASPWSDNSITATIPNGATSGPILVIVNGQISNGVFFAVDSGLVVRDTFTGANGTAVGSHAPDIRPTGAVWAQQEGSPTSLQNGRARVPALTAKTSFAIETGVANGVVGVDIISSSASVYGGVIFRVESAGNMLGARYAGNASGGVVGLFARYNGNWGQRAQVSVPPLPAGTVGRLEVRFNGTQVEAIWRGTSVTSASIPEYVTATKHGVQWDTDDPFAELDNFEVRNTMGAPVISGPPDLSSVEGSQISLQILANDLEGQSLSYGAVGLPPGLVVNASTGVISGTINFNTVGTYSVTLSASDGTNVTTRPRGTHRYPMARASTGQPNRS